MAAIRAPSARARTTAAMSRRVPHRHGTWARPSGAVRASNASIRSDPGILVRVVAPPPGTYASPAQDQAPCYTARRPIQGTRPCCGVPWTTPAPSMAPPGTGARPRAHTCRREMPLGPSWSLAEAVRRERSGRDTREMGMLCLVKSYPPIVSESRAAAWPGRIASSGHWMSYWRRDHAPSWTNHHPSGTAAQSGPSASDAGAIRRPGGWN